MADPHIARARPSEPHGYPPEPWDLRGQLYLSVFAIPRADFRVCPPDGTHPMLVGGRHMVGVAWAVYEPGSVLLGRGHPPG
ncbi:hypothetical protein [Streptomyces flavidovirens]|uniref:hypothetical protein n=1 Tax=Streptomyces flavidovirens TaxID=67298 RepID=UPI00048DB4D3|nr:hypothetical protein [Streptomyces flavidovirens]